MKNYRVTVNGNTYDVAVEEVSGANFMPSAPVQSPQPQSAPAPVASPVAAPSGQGEPVPSPMPGNILDVKVKVGDKISVNQTVAILEAMKMENDINSPIAGTVVDILVAKGAAVDSGQALIMIAKG